MKTKNEIIAETTDEIENKVRQTVVNNLRRAWNAGREAGYEEGFSVGYQHGFNDDSDQPCGSCDNEGVYEEGYRKGLDDAWEAVRKLNKAWLDRSQVGNQSQAGRPFRLR